MPLLIVLGVLTAIIGTVIFVVNRKESDKYIELQEMNKKVNRKAESENLNTFNSNPKNDED